MRKDHLLYETEGERNYRMQTTLFNKSKKQGQLYDVHPCTRRGLELGGTAGGGERCRVAQATSASSARSK